MGISLAQTYSFMDESQAGYKKKDASADFFSGRPDAADGSAHWRQSGFMGPLLTSCSTSKLSNSSKTDRKTVLAIRKALVMLSYQACGIAAPLETLGGIQNINCIVN